VTGSSFNDRQAETLRKAGKLLKRSRRVGNGHFIALAHEILEGLEENDSTLVILRIIHRANPRFCETIRQAYLSNRSIAEVAGTYPDVDEIGRVETYQRERIQIDVIYHDPNDQELIDEYKRILASCNGALINPSARARLMRIRTLSLRNEVPLSIFDTLEEILIQEAQVDAGAAEPSYIQSTREILGGFLLGKNINRKLSSLDMVQLMENKQRAAANRDQTFEELLLDTGRQIDEIARTVARIMDCPYEPVHLTARPQDPQRRRPNLERLRSLGWTPVTQPEDGLRETIAWFQTDRLAFA